MAKSPKRASTQNFTEIRDIVDNVVLLSGGNACIIIEVTATNFTLQSEAEQVAKISSYASLLNSLSFPVEIVIRSKIVNISGYLEHLTEEATKSQSEQMKGKIVQYKNFVSDLIRENTVLDKRFYFVISYSSLEKGPTGAANAARGGGSDFANQAKLLLRSKAESLLTEIGRIGIKARVLGKEELLSLLFDVYNNGEMNLSEITHGGKRPTVR